MGNDIHRLNDTVIKPIQYAASLRKECKNFSAPFMGFAADEDEESPLNSIAAKNNIKSEGRNSAPAK